MGPRIMRSVQASALAGRLLIGPGQSALVLNAPAGYEDAIQPLPPDATLTAVAEGVHDVVVLFASNRGDLERGGSRACAAVKPDGVLWMAYPKPKAGAGSDLTRDHGWGTLHAAGLVAGEHITLDSDWDALRFRPQPHGHIPRADLLPVGRQATFAYRVTRVFAVPLMHLAFRFEVHGRERIPKQGTYVVIANHLGWLDALTIAMVFPVEPRIHFLADPTGMMRRRLEWALIMATGGIVPVDRALHGDKRLYEHVDRCLQLGGAIALFPEGDLGPREGEMLSFKSGFAHFAIGNHVPVVPVALSGPRDVWLGKRSACSSETRSTPPARASTSSWPRAPNR